MQPGVALVVFIFYVGRHPTDFGEVPRGAKNLTAAGKNFSASGRQSISIILNEDASLPDKQLAHGEQNVRLLSE